MTKRDTRKSPDTDIRGRVRRCPPRKLPRGFVDAKFVDGPLAGTVTAVQKGADMVFVGPESAPFWVYTFAGREGKVPLYARWPEKRLERKLIRWYVGQHGRDPRAMRASAPRREPKVGKTDKRGQGAARRRARREAQATDG